MDPGSNIKYYSTWWPIEFIEVYSNILPIGATAVQETYDWLIPVIVSHSDASRILFLAKMYSNNS